MRKPIVFLLSALFASLILISQASAQTPGQLIWVQTNNPGGIDWARGVAVDSTGIYIVGYDSSPGQYDWQWRMEKRSLTGGSLIWSQTSNPGALEDLAWGVAVDSTGVYIVGYDVSPGSNAQWRIEKRSLSSGSLIWFQTNNPSVWSESPVGVAIDSTGIYIVGDDQSPGYQDSQWRIEKRSLSSGSLIWTQTTNLSASMDSATGVAVDSTGVYIVGYDNSPGINDVQWRIEKRDLNNGNLIWFQTSNPSNDRDEANGIAVDNTGVYIVGVDRSPGYQDSQWRIEKRSLSTGSIIWTQTTNLSASLDSAAGVVVDSTGIYIVGYDSSPGYTYEQWRIEKRSLSTGSLIWFQTSNPSAWSRASGVAVDSTGAYIVGVDVSPGNPQWRIERRYVGPRLVISGSPNIGDTITISLIDPLHANTNYVLAMAFGTSPGIILPDGRVIPLNLDSLLTFSLQYPTQIGLFNSFGTLNAQGQAQATWTIPLFAPPSLTIYLAFVTIDPTAPSGIASISPPVQVTILP